MKFRPSSVRRRVRYLTTAEVAALLARDERLRAAAAATGSPASRPPVPLSSIVSLLSSPR